jgi:hypothetical protein
MHPACPAHPILLDLILIILVKATSYEGPYNAVFSNILEPIEYHKKSHSFHILIFKYLDQWHSNLEAWTL